MYFVFVHLMKTCYSNANINCREKEKLKLRAKSDFHESVAQSSVCQVSTYKARQCRFSVECRLFSYVFPLFERKLAVGSGWSLSARRVLTRSTRCIALRCRCSCHRCWRLRHHQKWWRELWITRAGEHKRPNDTNLSINRPSALCLPTTASAPADARRPDGCQLWGNRFHKWEAGAPTAMSLLSLAAEWAAWGRFRGLYQQFLRGL